MPLGVEDTRTRDATKSSVSDTEQRRRHRTDGTGVDRVVRLGLTGCSSAGAKYGTSREAQTSQTGQ